MFFGLDIGTKCDDLQTRHSQLEECINTLPPQKQTQARAFLYYSAGIWPDVEEIKNRTEAVKMLQNQINSFPREKLVAIGECGLDHHWNPSGVDGRNKDDFSAEMYEGERELFQIQIDMARTLALPVIIHSRDAFEDTLDCIKNMGYHSGIIHCYSYGKDEAKRFLDLGWYIAFGGGTTYTKKSKMDEMTELLRYVPNDRILLETDSPYLAPVPFRGQTNTPVLIEHVYQFIATARGVSPETLSETVDKNTRTLFSLTEE